MEYFELVQSKNVRNPVAVMKLDRKKYNHEMTKEDFEALERLKVAYFSGRETEEACDILTDPAYMVSDRLRKVLKLYDKTLEFKGVQLFPTSELCGRYPIYWIPGFERIDCLHGSVEKYDNGMLKRLVLDERKAEGHPVFRIGGILEYKVVVALPVAESILRRRPYGVSLQRVEVK